ncbi:VCBS repeat-containing protein [Luteolibacter ambystomatis]|uniref:VCBS repeat-containing protein n=1 Tax=Luteolibacter ambystomatis TaxID=2824561 RepID=A0A975J2S4_9BACT|nr:RHS repeat-associated core domain-containing protein [Luteolibacter ambystomatis]QUE52995.1 VCBS repeat-containing protein [Luteolibacter ambystomatis]
MRFNYASKWLTVFVLQLAFSVNLFAMAFVEPFESPAPGTNPAWWTETGESSLVADGPTNKVLRLSPALNEGNETKVVRPITWDETKTIAFIDFMVKPAANPEGSLAAIYVNGTQIAFQVTEGDADGTIWAYHGNDDDENQPSSYWVETPSTYAFSSTTLKANAFNRITLRHDYGRQVWDLFVDGKISAANLGFSGRGDKLDAIEFYGGTVADQDIDQLQADPDNMLFPDADKDGLPDAWETANGSNPNVYDRDNLAPNGKSFLENYIASLWSTTTVPNAHAVGGAVSSVNIPPLTIIGSHEMVGSLKGAMTVGGDGSSNYSIPLDLPKGTGGMEPKLSFNYSSGGGNGPLGVGWSLGGLEKIVRVQSSAVKDGSFDPVDFDQYDRFLFNGERLVCVSGTYGTPGSEYRTEIDSYAKIKFNTATSPAKPYWTVQTKSGLTVTLGETADSREDCTAGTLAWGVSKVSDTVGNYYKVDYTRDTVSGIGLASQRVASISYTGHEGSFTQAPYCTVYFDYETREDQTRTYSPNTSYLMAKRLAKVRVTTKGFCNHSYVLAYDYSYQSKRSFLKSVQKLGMDQPTQGVPATTFTYGGLTSTEQLWSAPSNSEWPVYNATWDTTGNVNSMVTTSEGGTLVRLDGDVSRVHPLTPAVTLYSDSKLTFQFRGGSATGGSFVSGAYIGFDTDSTYTANPARLTLIKGSGTAPAIAKDSTITYNPASTPDGWQTMTINVGGIATGSHGYFVLMNVDDNPNDGVSSAEFRDLRLYRGDTQVPADVSAMSFSAQWEMPHFLDSLGKDLGIRFIDLDGDGLQDMCDWRAYGYTNTSGTLAPDSIGQVFRNTGNGFTVAPSLLPEAWMPLSSRKDDLEAYHYDRKHHLFAQPMDINGDGKMDLMCSTAIKYSGGALSNDLTFWTQVDIGGGAKDWRELTAYKMPFRMKNIGSSAPYGGTPRDQHAEWVDIDSDGYLDFVCFTTSQGKLVNATNDTTVIVAGDKPTAWLNRVHKNEGWVQADALAFPEMLKRTYPAEEEKGRRLADLDADGHPEVLEAISAGTGELRKSYAMTFAANGQPTGWNETPGAENPPTSTGNLDLPTGSGMANAAFVNVNADSLGTQMTDFNNDGLADVIRSARSGSNLRCIYMNTGSTTSRWAAEPAAGGSVDQRYTYDLPRPLNFVVSNVYYPVGYEFADINGDGLTDIIFGQNDVPDDATINNNAVMMNTGSGWLSRNDSQKWGMPNGVRFSLSQADAQNGKRRARLQDLNGDGFPDLIAGLVDQAPSVLINQCRPEVMTSVTDGYGATLAATYQRLNDPAAVSGDAGGRPVYLPWVGTSDTDLLPEGQIMVRDNRLVVSRLIESDGRGGSRATRHHFGDLRFDRINDVSLGFGKAEVYDELWTGVPPLSVATTAPTGGNYFIRGCSKTTMSRTFPHAGSPVTQESYINVTSASPSGIETGVSTGFKLVKRDLSAYGTLASTTGVAGGTILRPVQIKSVNTTLDINGTVMTETVASNPTTNFDAYGFLTFAKVGSKIPSGSVLAEITDVAAAIATAEGHTDFSSLETTNTYDHNVSGDKWHLGRLRTATSVARKKDHSPLTKQTSYSYHSTTGLLEEERVEPNDSLLKSITTYGRDGYGNITSTSVEASSKHDTYAAQTRSKSTSFNDPDDSSFNGRFPCSETNAIGTVYHSYDQERALLMKTKNIDTLFTTFSYDIFGTHVTTLAPDGTQAAEITRKAGNADLPSAVVTAMGGSSIRWMKGKQASGSPWAVAYYDALGRQVASETMTLSAYGSGGSQWKPVYSVIKYDSQGRKTDEAQPFFIGETIRWTSYVFDDVGRVLKTTHPDGTVEEVVKIEAGLSASGEPFSYIKAKGRMKTSGEDTWGTQYAQRWNNAKGTLLKSLDDSGLTSDFDYDAEGKLLTATVGSIVMMTNTYDTLGRKTQGVDKDAGTSKIGYSGFGETVFLENASGEQTLTEYDAMGRVTKVIRPSGEGTFDYAYKPGSPGKGLLESIQKAGVSGWSETLHYDRFARPDVATRNRNTESFTTETHYDALGRVDYTIDAGGLMVVHEYDKVYSAKIRSSIFKPGSTTDKITLWEARAFDSAGRPTQQYLAQGVTTDTTYEAATGKTLSISSTGPIGTLQNLTFEWDSKTNLKKRQDTIAGQTETFTYDTSNRLVSSSIGGSYYYDANGNLTSKDGETRTYGTPRVHAVAQATIKSQLKNYAYDAGGHVTSEKDSSNNTIRAYTWTSFGQLESVSQSSCPLLKTFDPSTKYDQGGSVYGIPLSTQFLESAGVASFEFDSAGDRSAQTLLRTYVDTSVARVDTTYLGSYEREVHSTIAAGTSTQTVVKTIHRHHLGAAIYTVESGTGGSSTKLSTLLTDHLGSTDVLLVGTWGGSAFGNFKAERQSFDAWGERRNPDTWVKWRGNYADGQRTSAANFHHGYTGHEMLDDFGLVHMNGRIYDAELGRFLSADPYVQAPELSQNFNRYSYVLNNPLSYTDPTGHIIFGLPTLIIWAAEFLVVRNYCKQHPNTFVGQMLPKVYAFAVTVAVTVATGGNAVAGGAAGGATDAFLSGGNAHDVLRAAGTSAVQAAITAGVLHNLEPGGWLKSLPMPTQVAAHVVGHGLVGGAANEAMGGKFMDGFLSAAAGALGTDMGIAQHLGLGKPGDSSNVFARDMVAAVIGGTAAELGGGKFANGAFMAAFQHHYNAEFDKWSETHYEADDRSFRIDSNVYGNEKEGVRSGKIQIHIGRQHEEFVYNPEKNEFFNKDGQRLPMKIRKAVLKNSQVQRGLNKAIARLKTAGVVMKNSAGPLMLLGIVMWGNSAAGDVEKYRVAVEGGNPSLITAARRDMIENSPMMDSYKVQLTISLTEVDGGDDK